MTSTYSGITALIIASLPSLSCANALQQDLHWEDLTDRTFRTELGGTGPYTEALGTDTIPLLPTLATRQKSASLVEFLDPDLRLRIETQPFTGLKDVHRSRRGALLDGEPVLGWIPAEHHRRVSRMELVWNGTVIPLPVQRFYDVFDPWEDDQGDLFATVSRSMDGDRVYAQLIVPHENGSAVISWIFENGHFVGRVVDTLE